MNDIGRSHVVLHRQASDGPRKYLVRVETHIQGASLFVYISREKEPWPIRIRNDTALPLSFQQTVNLPVSSVLA
jgi:vacuolar protein sorting-associated protein 13A/C